MTERYYRGEGLRVRASRTGRSGTRSRPGGANRRPLTDDDRDVPYQVPLVCGGVRGIADTLLRVVHEDVRRLLVPVPRRVVGTVSGRPRTIWVA